jgi:hypothetical protein
LATGVGIDPRGPRFAAALTTIVLAVALLTGSAWVLLVQAAVFAVGALGGVQRTPYSALFRRLVRPRLGPPAELEDPAPPRFAQLVGLVVTGVALLLAAAGLSLAVEIGAGLALVAAFLNAAFGLCLGCELYLLLRRARGSPLPRSPRRRRRRIMIDVRHGSAPSRWAEAHDRR